MIGGDNCQHVLGSKERRGEALGGQRDHTRIHGALIKPVAYLEFAALKYADLHSGMAFGEGP